MKLASINFFTLFTTVTFLSLSSTAKDPYAAAPTPALPPNEAQKHFKVPDGFEVRLFAGEPDVINPVAMTWDERGRLWVLELYEYPKGAPAGQEGRDRIKILEDTDGDGRADKVTVFADGFSLATGLAVGNGGVYVGQAPDLYFIPRLDDGHGGDKAGERQTLLTGFGLQDRHELLNSFTWGPDGWLYMTQGVFTVSKVRDPNNPTAPTVEINGAIARFHPRTKKFELFAEGTSNPWGVDFDRYGNAFVSACVIDHLFHIVQGGVYVRQAGTPANPYAYELLPSIVKHKHQMAAYSGICVYQGDNFPEEYRGTVFMGNIHGNCINHDKLVPNGSSWRAEKLDDFLSTDDEWFRPVSEQVGPDGALWLMDWYDKYPCYQNANADPAGIDRERGRIWRVVYTGNKKGTPLPPRPDNKMDLSKLTTDKLVGFLASENVWQRRTSQRIISERRDEKAVPALKKLLANGKTLEVRLAALWTLHTSEQLEDPVLDSLIKDKDPALRAWVARLSSQGRELLTYLVSGGHVPRSIERLHALAKDNDPSVRVAVALAIREAIQAVKNPNFAGQLYPADVVSIPALLVELQDSANDPLLVFMTWIALEPTFIAEPSLLLNRLRDRTDPAGAQLIRRSMRRIADTNKPELLDEAVKFLGVVKDDSLTIAAMDGLLDDKRKSLAKPTVPTSEVLSKLIANPNSVISDRAKRLAVLWGDSAAAEVLLKYLNDPKATDDQRLEAIGVARQLKNENGRTALLEALGHLGTKALQIEVIQALGEVGGDKVADQLLARWKDFPPEVRRAAIDVLASRPAWATLLLQSLSSSSSSSKPILSDFHPTVIRTLAQYNDPTIRDLMTKTIGHYRASTDETARLIVEKRKVVLSGPVDFKAGHEMTKKTCLVCHTLHAEGATVGPDLTGSGRSMLDALLTNVLDPNQIIGKGYEQVNVTTQDDQMLSGRLVEDTADHVKLLSAGPKEDVIAKSDIKSMKVSELSVMPEGLGGLPDADFRNLIWYVLSPEPTPEGLTTAQDLAKKYPTLITMLSPSSSISPIQESGSRNGNLNGSILDGKPETFRVTYDGKKVDEDWYALEFSTARTIARVLFFHGKNFHDGGWFDTSAGKPKLQIKTAADAAWKTIATLENYPTTNATNPPDLKDGQRFEFKLAEHVSAVAIRILGKPSSGDNPTQAFSSCAELQALGK